MILRGLVRGAVRRWYIIGLVAYAGVLLFRLDRVPLLNPDEAAYTEPAWTLLTTGGFGAPMYTGLLRIDQRWYFLWPGYAVLTVLPYALLGVDVLAVRLLSGLWGAILLVAIWCLTWRLAAQQEGLHASRLAPLASLLAALHPTLFFLSRYGRPEIAVAALAVLSSALGARAWQSPGTKRWHVAAGAAAGVSFLMHQYGGLALAALAASYLLRSPRELRRAGDKALLAALGVGCAVLPWLLWVGSDWPEFRAQLAVQLAYQRWRYPDATAAQTLARELPGRYLLNRSDYPPGWDAWREAELTLVGPRAAGVDAGGSLAQRAGYVAVYWFRAGPAIPGRWVTVGVMGLVLLAGIAASATNRPAYAGRRRWVLLPLAVWIAGLALIPNKWDGYTGAVAAYTAVAAAGLFSDLLAGRRAMPRDASPIPARLTRAAAGESLQSSRLVRFTGILFLSAAAITWLLTDVSALGHPAIPYAAYAERLRDLVPPGEPVAAPMREWFAFAGRNPVQTIEFRSVPPFRTSLLEMMATLRPRYLVLHRVPSADAGAAVQRYHFVYPPWDEFHDYVDRSTALVGRVSDPAYGTMDVYRVFSWPAAPLR